MGGLASIPTGGGAATEPGDRSPRGAVDKALAVLSALIAADRPMRLTEVARQTGLAKSTVHRLIGILLAHQMIDQDGERYIPGWRLIEVRGWVGGEYLAAVGRAAKPHLVDLYEATGVTSSLAVLVGAEVQYLDRIYGQRSVRTPSYRSDRAPAHCTAIGKILLARCPDSPRRIRDGQALAAMTEATVTDPLALWAHLCEARRAGFAVSRGEYVDGVECVAAFVGAGARQRPLIGIAVSGRPGQVGLSGILPRLRRAAFALSVAIRHRPLAIDS